ncbi:hypothetical protein U14_05102 [Candidatus Moduliflexus flocculans]|uniref:Transposase n=1 Tax=Candidatus Moduliflexus flocculans TaxID=1499966 RepID=A0A081BQZ7_9BACT|nr:hypothetical protein U14_05102 [Candidatus Moduliflexus flocculans]
MTQNPWPYRVDGELGRIEFPTYRVCQQDITRYDTARAVFPPLGCWERDETRGFKELALIYGVTEQSYPKTATWLNRIRHQEGATGATTLRASVEREGRRAREAIEGTTTDMLCRAGFDETGQPVTAKGGWSHAPVVIPAEQIATLLDACDLTAAERHEIAQNPVCYEHPAETVNVSLDDVVVKQQKQHRTKATEESVPVEAEMGRKYVRQTVAHLQQQAQTYCITGQGGPTVLRIVLAYLLNMGGRFRLQFFVDGQKPLHAAILRAFSWGMNLGLILDWYHLEDKCKRQLRLAMRGATRRNAVLEALSPLLWYGRVASAVRLLQDLPGADLKNAEAIRDVIGYFERNRAYMPCYEVRKRLGLRNSSQIGEKMNDLLVSNRQKHQGMSWSVSGSSAIAAVETLKRNNEYHHWFDYHEIALKQVA